MAYGGRPAHLSQNINSTATTKYGLLASFVAYRTMRVSSRPRHAPPLTRAYTCLVATRNSRTVRKHPQATTCAMRPVVCKACNNKVVASALARHELETCPMRMVECEQGCGEEVPVSGLARHLSKVGRSPFAGFGAFKLLRTLTAAQTHSTGYLLLHNPVLIVAVTPCFRIGLVLPLTTSRYLLARDRQESMASLASNADDGRG